MTQDAQGRDCRLLRARWNMAQKGCPFQALEVRAYCQMLVKAVVTWAATSHRK